jgi:8-oxo-dGTP pyrophosphatase MutT (NUDIX family)
MKEELPACLPPTRTDPGLVPEILRSPEAFISQAEEHLGKMVLDYEGKTAGGVGEGRAGILLLLSWDSRAAVRGEESSLKFVFLRRAASLPQAGDLCSPGGILSPWRDRLLGQAVSLGLLPVLSRKAGAYLAKRSRTEASLVRIFMAAALREAWEEIGLPPWKVRILGALPTYSLSLFARIIFPILGVVDLPVAYRLNYESEKIVTIPLHLFWQRENYGVLELKSSRQASGPGIEYPCFFPEEGENGEVLWGATYQVATGFLKNFSPLPEQGAPIPRRRVKILDESYWGKNGAAAKSAAGRETGRKK